MRGQLPHQQLDQWAPPEISAQLTSVCLSFPDVRERQSRMAAEGTRAICLPDEVALGPREAFIDDHEFCHLHPRPEGSVHLTLPETIRELATDLGWAEQHPIAAARLLPSTLVLVYAPRDDRELAVVLQLVQFSWRFARGEAVWAT